MAPATYGFLRMRRRSLVCWDDNDADMKWVDISDTEFIVNEGDRACTPHI